MARVMYCTTYSDDGTEHTFEIHSTATSVNSANTFTLDTPEPVVRHLGQRDVFNPIIPTSLEFNIRLDGTEPHVDTWIDDLIDAPVGRFYVKWYLGGLLQYIGTILQDQIVLEDNGYPYSFKVTCTDALGLLDKYPLFEGDSDVVDTIRFPLLDILQICLNRTGFTDYYGTGERFIGTSVNWIETTRTGDPVKETWIALGTWLKDQDGEITDTTDSDIEFWKAASQSENCRKVVEDICRLFNARIFQVSGTYYLQQISLNENVNNTYYLYDPIDINTLTYSFIQSESIGWFQNVDKVLINKLPGSTWTFLDPLSYVVIKHNLGANNNILRDVSFYDRYLPDATRETKETQLTDIAEIDSTGEAIIKFSTKIEHYTFKTSNPTVAPMWPVMYFLLSLTLKVGSYYYKRHRTLLNDADEWEYSEGEWTTTPSVCEIVTSKTPRGFKYLNSIANKVLSLVEFETPKLEASGALTIKIEDTDFLSNSKRHRLSKISGNGTDRVTVSAWTMPTFTGWTEEDINKVIKVKVNNDAHEYKTTPTTADHFTIDGQDIVFTYNIPSSLFKVNITYIEHGPALSSDYDNTATFLWGWETKDLSLIVDSEDEEKNTSDNDYLAYISTIDRNNREFLEIETPIGDLKGGDSVSMLGYYSGGIFTGTDLWQVGGTGTSYNILELKARDMASLRSERRRIMQTGLYIEPLNFGITFHPGTRLTYEFLNYIMLDGQYFPLSRRHDGSWFNISRNEDNVIDKQTKIVGNQDIRTLGSTINDRVILTGTDVITRSNDPLLQGLQTFIPIVEPGQLTIRAGDVIRIQNPTTGESQEVTVLQDVGPTDTQIVIDEYIDYNFEEGALINVVTKYTITEWKERFTGNTGTTLTVNNGTLPDELQFSDAEMDSKITVERNGVVLWYNSTSPSFDEYYVTSATGVITFGFALRSTDKVKIKVRY